MRRAAILAVLLVAGCSGRYDVLSEAETRAKLTQHRKAYEWLAADVRTCGLDRLTAVGDVTERCAGKGDKPRLQTAMQTLGIREAVLVGSDVRLMTGADSTYGQPMGVPVASWLIHTQDADRLPNPLTPAPSHWFYAQHD